MKTKKISTKSAILKSPLARIKFKFNKEYRKFKTLVLSKLFAFLYPDMEAWTFRSWVIP